MATYRDNIATSSQLIYSNLEFLFKLNKIKNFQNKSDFFRETNISRQALGKWKQGSIPARTTLNRIINYFNKWLYLNLTPEMLLKSDLKEYINKKNFIREDNKEYLTYNEQQMLYNFKKLDDSAQKLIIQLIIKLGEKR